MSRLLRRKLVCFYCNRRSAQDRGPGVRQWQCEKCDAVNHLDENGEITDPPTQETFLPMRYAQPPPRSLSPEPGLLQRSLFCQRCIQNQHIVNQALAEYLPSQDDPRYLEFERKLSGYRRKMEADFPQVCETCAPAVEDRIRSTGYAAKADHLRRTMDRTRGTGVTHNSWTRMRVVALLGAIGWLTGLLGHLSWNILGVLPMIQAEDGLVDNDNPQSLVKCFVYGAFNLQFTPSCEELAQPLPAYAFVLSLLCFWWNPRMQYTLRGGYSRIVGYVEYYKLQLVALVIRYLGWKMVAKDSAVRIDPQAARALHAFSLVAGSMLTLLSFNAIRIDQRPLVTFQESYEPLIPTDIGQRNRTAIQRSRREASPPSRPRVEPFPVDKLAPRPQQPAYQPPTPPPEEDDDDTAMEWTPQHKFRPASIYRAPQLKPTFNEPSPFHGVIPPAPVSWAQRLRNPPNQPTFQKASEAKKENFFGKKSKRIESDAASDVTSPAPSITHDSMAEIDSPLKFAPPRFFAPADRMETGLESLFSDAFSLGQEQSSRSHPEQQDDRAMLSPPASSPLPRLLITLLLGSSCVVWDYASVMSQASRDSVRLIIIVIAGLNAIYNLSFEIPRTDRSLGYIILQMVELLAAVMVAHAMGTPSSSEKQDQITTSGLWYLMVLTVQEGWIFVSSLAASPGVAQVEVQQALNQSSPAQVKRAQVKRAQAPNGPSKYCGGKTPAPSTSSTLAMKTKSNSIELNQRTTRSKARKEVRRDSLGVDRLGSLSLDGC